MAQYPLPPWLSRPADPAAHYASGLQIGMKMGQEQAQAELSKQMLEREITRDAVDQQVKQQTLQLRTQQAAQAYKARQQYEALVASGVDPQKALLQIGPSLGIPMSGMAQLARPPLPHYGEVPGVGMVQVEPTTGRSRVVQAEVPRSIQPAKQEEVEMGGRKFIRTTQPSGTVSMTDLTRPQEQAETRQLAKAQAELRRIDRQIEALKKDDPYVTGDLPLSPKMNPAFRAAKQKKIDDLKTLEAQRDDLEEQLKTGAAPEPPAAASAPTATGTNAPPSKFKVIKIE